MYKKLICVLLLVSMCFPVVMAVDYTGTVSVLIPGTQIITSIAKGSEGAFKERPWIINWSTNFDSVGIPSQIQMYSSTDNKAVASGVPFALADQYGTYATGTISMTNGTNFYPGAGKQSYTFDFDTWNPGTRTGTILGNMTTTVGTNYFTAVDIETAAGVTIGFARQAGTPRASYGYIYIPYDYESAFDYSITKVGGAGTGTISNIDIVKSSSSNIASNVQVRNYTAPNTLIGASPFTTVTGSDYLSVVGDNYVLSLYLPFNSKYYNSTTVFFPTGYGPTPTPTPTGTPVPSVPSGATRTTIFLTDSSTGAKIIGGSIGVRDTGNLTWTNSTSSNAGSIVDVLTGHTIDIYGSATGFSPSYELGATAGGNYYLPLVAPTIAAPVGYVNMFVNVFDSSTNNIIQSASVTAKLPTGATTGENTGTTGTVIFLVPNNTVVILGASASGYGSTSQSVASGTGADKIVNVRLTRQTVTSTVTPVVTDPGTGAVITAVPTIDARTSNQKDLDMMNLLRDNGGTIISLAILAIIFGLLKMIMKF